jgi:O-antigen/teichoic acid export membrane protein
VTDVRHPSSRSGHGASGGAAGRLPRVASIRLTWSRHRALLSNVATLAATTGVTSAVGFVYWAIAARIFSVQAVGYASAAISAMTLLGTIGMLGFGTLLIGELPRRKSPGGLVWAALLFSSLASLLIGVGFVAIAPRLSAHFGDIAGNTGRACLFASGVSVTALSLVLDQATIGLLRGGLQLGRNVTASVVKLAILPVTALVFRDGFGVGLIFSWVGGTVLSLIAVGVRIWWTRVLVFERPDWRSLRSLARTTLAHNWLNLSIAIRQSIIPVLVAVVISPRANAAFYAAWMIASFLAVVPAHLSTVLFAVTSADADAVAAKIRFTLRLSFLIGIPGMIIVATLGRPMLALFGAHYASAGSFPLLLLVIAYVPSVFRAHYIAVYRIKGKMGQAAGLMWAVMGLEVIASVAGGKSGGLIGLSIALLAVRLAEGIVTAPSVIAIAARRGQHRRTYSGSAGRERAAPSPSEAVRDWNTQQAAGLSALMALSLLAERPTPYLRPQSHEDDWWSPDRERDSMLSESAEARGRHSKG